MRACTLHQQPAPAQFEPWTQQLALGSGAGTVLPVALSEDGAT